MRNFLLLSIFLLAMSAGLAQQPADSTLSILVRGDVRQEKVFTRAVLEKMEQIEAGDIPIVNHLGVVKKSLKNARGVRLREVLGSVELNSENPKEWSAYCFVCAATDGYTVVFSWNELFNHPNGDKVLLLLEHDGKTAGQLDDRIALIAPADSHTGRRYVKGLTTISVKRLD